MTAAGRGVAANAAEAARWFHAAADQGFEPAESSLGALYESGKGVPQDFAAAAAWYRKAADQGSPVAQNNLGVLYAKGLGVARDPAEAYFWFNLAAEGPAGGNRENAAANRDALVGELTPGQTAAVQQRLQQWHPTKPAS